MGLFDLFKKNTPEQQTFNKNIWEFNISKGQANIMPDNPEAYLKQGYSENITVYSIVQRVDKMRKQAKLKLYDANDKEIWNHELSKFLYNVNSYETINDFITAHIIYRMIVGEAFIYKPSVSLGPNKGIVAELHMLPAGDVEIIEGTYFDPVSGYRLKSNYQSTFAKEDIYHSKVFNPNWRSERSLHGLSPLRASAKTVSKLSEIEITQLKQIQNQSPPYALYRDGDGAFEQQMTTEQQSQLEGKLKSHTKQEKRGVPLILKQKFGKLELGATIADMALKELTDAGVIQMCAVYGLPAELMGYGDKTYNNMATARKSAWTDCIIPELTIVEETLNAILINGKFDGMYFKFDYTEVEELSEGIETKVGWMTKARWTGNEIRIATGKTPIDAPEMDEPIIPMGEGLLSDLQVDLTSGQKDFTDYIQKKIN